MILTFDLWPWKSIGFQLLIRTKYVPSLVKIHWRMLILECSQGCYGRTTDDSVSISLRNFVGEGIIKIYKSCFVRKLTTVIILYNVCKKLPQKKCAQSKLHKKHGLQYHINYYQYLVVYTRFYIKRGSYL